MKTIVVGGGASGMMAAYYRQISGNQVILFEKNEKLGKKLYITGKGRCNLTNDCEPQEFLNNVVSNPKFLISSINSYTPKDVMDFFEAYGLQLKVERGNRVFPLSDKSSDVIKTLKYALETAGVDVRYNETVVDVLAENGVIKGVVTDKKEYLCDNVIIATGGLSYASTGSTGDGYKFAKSLGHTVTELRPSLCGLNLQGNDFKELQGLTLKNVKLSAKDKKGEFYSEQGEMLFTHFGVSGPLVLTLSALMNMRKPSDVTISIDLKPALDGQQLDLRVLRDLNAKINKEFKNSLDELLPKALIPLVIKRSNIAQNKKNNSITVEERNKLVSVLKGLEFKVASLRDYTEAVITSGGVSVKEVNPKTMESKLVKGLYFVGEVLDLDAFTGGFNLQIAFSTAHSAGVAEE
ncbi:MAG: NAD(P)/FAD-dependent oxidoreductase [Clostridia bacterium]|nr:NAD(P)/FAD-dependent oxidoreductase [Clostridia bacterium]